jgi:hypothetical protein
MRRRTQWILLASAALPLAAASALGWHLRPRQATVYTDADSIRLPAEEARLRHILWQPAVGLPEPLSRPGASGYDPAVADDGLTLIFALGAPGGSADLYRSRRTARGWSEPEPLEDLNSPADELGPALGPDGVMYFSSDRAGGSGGYDLWMAPPRDEGWGAPVNLGPRFNSDSHETSPAVAPRGDALYFASNRPGPDEPGVPGPDAGAALRRADMAQRDDELYVAELTGTAPAAPLAALNSEFHDSAPTMSPGADFLYFASDRPGGHGGFDLWRARLLPEGILPPQNAGDALNGPWDELDPALALGGFGLYFTSDRPAEGGGRADRLYFAASREVFAEVESWRAALDLAALWRAIWPALLAMILGVLLLLALLRFALARPQRLGAMGLLARCLLGSLAAHLLLLLLLSAVHVTTTLADALRRPSGTRVLLTSAASGGDVSGQVRGHLTSTAALAPAAAPAERQAMNPMDAPDPMPVALAAAELTLQPAAPLPVAEAEPDASAAPPPPRRAPDAPAPTMQAAVPSPPSSAAVAASEAAVRLAAADAHSQPRPERPDQAGPAAATTLAPEVSPQPARDPLAPQPATVASAAPPAVARASTPLRAPRRAAGMAVPAAPAEALPEASGAPAPEAADGGGSRHAAVRVAPAAAAAAVAPAPHPAVRAASPALREMATDDAPASAVTPRRVAPRPDPGAERSMVAAIPAAEVAGPVAEATTPAPRGDVAAGAPATLAAARAEEAAPARLPPEGAPRSGASVLAAAGAEPATATPPAPRADRTLAVSAPSRSHERLATPSPVPAGQGTETSSARRVEPTSRSRAAAASAAATMPLVAIDTHAPRDLPPQPLPHLEARDAKANPLPVEPVALLPAAPLAIAGPAHPASTDAADSGRPPSDVLASAGVPADRAAPPLMAAPSAGAATMAPAAAAVPQRSLAAPLLADSAPSQRPRAEASAPAPHPAAPTLPRTQPALPAPRFAAAPEQPVLAAPWPPAAAPRAVAPRGSAVLLPSARLAPAAPHQGRPEPILAAATAQDATQPPDRRERRSAVVPRPPRASLPLPEVETARARHFAQRAPEVREQHLQRFGGSRETEEAVKAALDWLARHQAPAGNWPSRGFDDPCGECGGAAKVHCDVALVGLSLLCFLAADHSPNEDGPYRATVERALEWLARQQHPSGNFAPAESLYSHGIATIALAEAYALTADARLERPLVRAIQFIDEARNRSVGGWRYEPGQAGDTSVLGWQVMAISSARRAGVTAPAGSLDAARQWLDKVGRSRPGVYAYQPGHPVSPAMTAEGLFVRQLLGQPRPDGETASSVSYLLEHLPDWKADPNTYYWYYATLALFQHGGDAWSRWNEAVKTELLAHQHRGGRAAGSWDPLDTWASVGGRVYQTAICTLTLEVYYRYLPLYLTAGEAPAPD